MKMLFVLPHPLLPVTRGNKQYTCGLLRHISQAHQVDAIVFAECDGGASLAGEVSEALIRELMLKELPAVKVLHVLGQRSGAGLWLERGRALLQLRPTVMARYRNHQLSRIIKKCAAHYDVVCFDMFMVSEHVECCAPTPAILLATDAYSMMMERALAVVRGMCRRARLRLEIALQRRYETSWYPRFAAVICVSPVDGAWLRRRCSAIPVEVVEIPLDQRIQALPFGAARSGMRVLCWSQVKNDDVARGVLSFIRDAWPMVRAASQGAELVVWGRAPHRLLRDALTAPGVSHVDYVDDWVDMLLTGSVFVYPQRCGSGLQTKLQAAMGAGLPIVTAPETCGGLPVVHGQTGFICTSPAGFAESCTALLMDRGLQSRIGSAGQMAVRERYTQGLLGAKLVAICEAAVARSKG